MSLSESLPRPAGDERVAVVRAPRMHGARFVPAHERARLCAELRGLRYVVAVPPQSFERGRLRAAVDEAIEGALALRGALPPAVEIGATTQATLLDQVFRARALGAAGLAIAFPSMGGMGAALEAADSEVVAVWIAATENSPVALLFDGDDRGASLLVPRPLSDLVRGAPVAALPRVVQLPKSEPEPEPEPAAESIFAVPRTAPPRPPPAPVPAPVPAPSPPHAETPTPTYVQREHRVLGAAEARTHALELDAARGPKPVNVIERLFTSRYVPLLGAVARGDVDGTVRGVVDGWRTSFEHSYKEAFAALRVTGKRPPMVFDAPEIAARIGRLNGARAVKLLLVDAMAYDVGERISEELAKRLAGRAVCVDKALLWSALPTTTATQFMLLGRGLEGLRDAEPPSDPEPEIARGRAIATVRRERAGTREIMKLDLVEARLRSAGPSYDMRLDAVAVEAADALARYVDTLPPRTLLFCFGDHGFRLGASPDGRTTGPATQGGLSPEEVLVGAYAWLVGGVH